MKRDPIILSACCLQVLSQYSHQSSSRSNISFASFSSFSAFGSSGFRSFPDYSPKRPSIKDTEFVSRISNIIKQRPQEPFRRILRSFESKFRRDHLIWVLLGLKNDYELAINLFQWSCIRRVPSLEARCILIHISATAKDLNISKRLCHDFLAKPSIDGNTSISQFVEKLIYTYKDWGSNLYVFDIFFQSLIDHGCLDDARKLFRRMSIYGFQGIF